MPYILKLFVLRTPWKRFIGSERLQLQTVVMVGSNSLAAVRSWVEEEAQGEEEAEEEESKPADGGIASAKIKAVVVGHPAAAVEQRKVKPEVWTRTKLTRGEIAKCEAAAAAAAAFMAMWCLWGASIM